jgi:hypothetical protein
MYDTIFHCSILLQPSWTVFSSQQCLPLTKVTTTTIHVNRTVWSLEIGHAERQCKGATMFNIRIVWTLLEQMSSFLWHCSDTHRLENDTSLKMLYLPESQMLVKLHSHFRFLSINACHSTAQYHLRDVNPPPPSLKVWTVQLDQKRHYQNSAIYCGGTS